MTVQELRDLLGDFPGDAEVMTEYDYGDHCNTRALNDPYSVEEFTVSETACSASGWCIGVGDIGDTKDVVVITT